MEKEVRMIEVKEEEFNVLLQFIGKQPLAEVLQIFGMMQGIIERNKPKGEEPVKPNRATRRKIEKAKF